MLTSNHIFILILKYPSIWLTIIFVVVSLLGHVWLFFGPMDCSLPGSSVQEIFQARILEWVAIAFSRGTSKPSDQSQVLYHLSHQESPIFIMIDQQNKQWEPQCIWL